MKKGLIYTLTVVLALLTLAGCSMYSAPSSNSNTTTGNAFNYKVGTATYTTTEETYGYSDGQNGKSSVKTAVVAAVFDTDGRIIKVSVDEIASDIYFDNSGKLYNFTPGEVQSKRELGTAYGMKKYSGIGKEWDEQADSLEKWLTGKKITDVTGGDKAMSGFIRSMEKYARNAGSSMYTDSSQGTLSDIMDNSAANNNDLQKDYRDDYRVNSWTDEDLVASVTIDTSGIRKALEKAYRNAK